MTTDEMILSFLVESKTIDLPIKPFTVDILYYLNKSQDELLKSYLQPVDGIVSQSIVDEVKNLYITLIAYPGFNSTTEPSTPISDTNLPDGYTYYNEDEGSIAFKLPSNYLYYVESKSKISGTHINQTDTTKYWVFNKYISKTAIKQLITNMYNKPILRNPYVYIQTSDSVNRISVIKDSYTSLYNIELSYIKSPLRLDVGNTCELNPILHRDIVSKAVDMWKELNNKAQ